MTLQHFKEVSPGGQETTLISHMHRGTADPYGSIFSVNTSTLYKFIILSWCSWLFQDEISCIEVVCECQ